MPLRLNINHFIARFLLAPIVYASGNGILDDVIQQCNKVNYYSQSLYQLASLGVNALIICQGIAFSMRLDMSNYLNIQVKSPICSVLYRLSLGSKSASPSVTIEKQQPKRFIYVRLTIGFMICYRYILRSIPYKPYIRMLNRQ